LIFAFVTSGVLWSYFVSPVNLRAGSSMRQQQLSFKSCQNYLPSLISCEASGIGSVLELPTEQRL